VREASECGYNWARTANGCCYNRVRLKLGAITNGCLPIYNLACELQLGADITGCDTTMDAAATGYDYNWVRLQLGAGCYGVRAATGWGLQGGYGYNWEGAVTGSCYNRVRLTLDAVTSVCAYTTWRAAPTCMRTQLCLTQWCRTQLCLTQLCRTPVVPHPLAGAPSCAAPSFFPHPSCICNKETVAPPLKNRHPMEYRTVSLLLKFRRKKNEES
jgi:hypothetical protein